MYTIRDQCGIAHKFTTELQKPSPLPSLHLLPGSLPDMQSRTTVKPYQASLLVILHVYNVAQGTRSLNKGWSLLYLLY